MSPLRLTLLAVLATLGCSSSSTTSANPPPAPPPPTPRAGTVDIAIASVTLADDCGTPPRTPPVRTASAVPAAESEPPAPGAMADVHSTQRIAAGSRACQQSSVQLRVVNDTNASATIAIKKIEVLSDHGEVVGELTARDASQWNADAYQPWDQSVGAKQTVQASYAVSRAPVSPGSTYIVRVTVATAEGDKTLEQKTTIEAEASLPPGVST